MSTFNLILFQGNADQAVTYYAITETGEFTNKIDADNLRALTLPENVAPWIVLLPTASVFLTTLDLPQVPTRELPQAVPFAIEDQFVQNVSDLYFAVERSEENKLVYVAVIEKKLFESYVAVLQECHIHPDVMLPTVLGLPWQPTQWTLAEMQGMALLRMSQNRGMAIEPENIEILLQTTKGEGEAVPERILIYGVAPKIDVAILSQAFPEKVEAQSSTSEVPFSKAMLENPSINLLQGAYRPKPKVSRIQRYWRWCLRLLVTFCIFIVCVNLCKFFYYRWEYQNIMRQMEALYSEIFPDTTMPDDPQTALQTALQKLEKRANDNMFDNLFRAFGAVVHESPGVHLNGFEYRDQHLLGVVTVQNESQSQALVQALAEQGLVTKIEKTKPVGDAGVVVELSMIQGAGTAS